MAISTNQKPTIYRNLYENTGPGPHNTDQQGSVINNAPAKIGHSPNAVLILDQRRRRWANIKPALVERLVFAGTLKRRYPTDNCCLT